MMNLSPLWKMRLAVVAAVAVVAVAAVARLFAQGPAAPWHGSPVLAATVLAAIMLPLGLAVFCLSRPVSSRASRGCPAAPARGR